MRNLLRCRRGTVAFATVIAAIPAIGAVALGAEAGSWYVTKQHAQNAADAAAYSGALRLACTLSASGTCDTTQTVDYRGKQFAAQNAFCNGVNSTFPGCNRSLGSAVSQTVAIDIGTYAGSTFAPLASGSYVRAQVSQTQPGYLANLLNVSTVTIGAQAIAKVNNNGNPCVLALTGSVSFQGSPNVNASGCGLASNDPAGNALNFTGGGMTVTGPLAAAGGCSGTATFCNNALTFQPPITNPFAALDAVTLPTLSICPVDKKALPTLTAYSSATPCRNDNVSLTGNNNIALSGGVYFISGKVTLTGTTAISGTGLFILLPGASFDLKGTGTISLTGNASVTDAQLPSVLQPYESLLANMAIYDQSATAVTIGGNSNLNFLGNMYIPNASVTFQGNPTSSNCGELVAASIAFNGNATFTNTGCGTATKPTDQYVSLVQ